MPDWKAAGAGSASYGNSAGNSTRDPGLTFNYYNKRGTTTLSTVATPVHFYVLKLLIDESTPLPALTSITLPRTARPGEGQLHVFAITAS